MSKEKVFLKSLGIIFILIGIIFNPWIVQYFFSPDKKFDYLWKSFFITIFNILIFITGYLIIKYNEKFMLNKKLNYNKLAGLGLILFSLIANPFIIERIFLRKFILTKPFIINNIIIEFIFFIIGFLMLNNFKHINKIMINYSTYIKKILISIKNKIKSNYKNILILLFVLTIILILFEFILILDVNLNYSKTKYSEISKIKIFGNLDSTIDGINSDLFRDVEHSIENNDNKIRIAFLGDSYTMGSSIPNSNDIFSSIFRDKLNKEFPNQYEVFNFGMGGANILDLYWILNHSVLKYEPDYIIYSFFQNDMEFYEHNIDYRYCFSLKGIKNEILIQNYLNDKKYNIMFRYELFNSQNKITLTVNEDYYGWKCFKYIINKLGSNNNINSKLIAFILPIEEKRIDGNYIMINETKNTFRKNNIKIIENAQKLFSNATRNLTKDEIYVNFSGGDMHFNEKINKILADILYDNMLEIIK